MTFDANKYRTDYQKNNYDRVVVYLPKGEKQKWKEAATKAGKKLNAYIVDSVSAKIGNAYRPARTNTVIPAGPTHSDPGDNKALYTEHSRQMDELTAQFSIDNYGGIPEGEDEAEDDFPFELGIHDTTPHDSKKDAPSYAYLHTVLAANQQKEDGDAEHDSLPWEE